MGRPLRAAVGGVIYHVLNRANGGLQLFEKAGDYGAFERVFEEAHERIPMRTLAYCLMPNHWHLVLWPRRDGDLSQFLAWGVKRCPEPFLLTGRAGEARLGPHGRSV